MHVTDITTVSVIYYSRALSKRFSSMHMEVIVIQTTSSCQDFTYEDSKVSYGYSFSLN